MKISTFQVIRCKSQAATGVLSIYTGNDLQAPERYPESVEKARNDGATGRGNGGNTAIPLSRRLLNSSYSLNFISAAVEALGKRFLPMRRISAMASG